MRELPGMVFAQSGARGSLAELFVRGGSSNYNLVLLNGIPINGFYYGGLFDFAQVPSDFISEIDVARGPQSAVYGSYAIGSVVNFVTRSPEDGPSLDIVAEGQNARREPGRRQWLPDDAWLGIRRIGLQSSRQRSRTQFRLPQRQYFSIGRAPFLHPKSLRLRQLQLERCRRARPIRFRSEGLI